jgi:hypothetical protein
MTVRSPMAIDPDRMVRPWAGRSGMDHDTGDKRAEDNNKHCYFGKG